MLTNETQAVLLEALECLRHFAGHHEYLGKGMHQFMPDLAKRAIIDAAIAEVKAEAGWVPVEDGDYKGESRASTFTVGGAWLTVRELELDDNIYPATIKLPDDIRLFRRTGSQEAAQGGKS